jgi:uncharacterized phage-associated protein
MPIVNHNRDRLLNIIAFFLVNTKHCYKLKLFKLLYFADIRHFQETGKPITALEYYAWPMGPVPIELNSEIDNCSPSLTKSIKVIDASLLEPESSSKAKIMKANFKFNENFFSTRELKILKEIAEVFYEVKSQDISLISHEPGGPWHRTYIADKNKQGQIPLIYALDDKNRTKVTKERAQEIETTRKELKRRFG